MRLISAFDLLSTSNIRATIVSLIRPLKYCFCFSTSPDTQYCLFIIFLNWIFIDFFSRHKVYLHVPQLSRSFLVLIINIRLTCKMSRHSIFLSLQFGSIILFLYYLLYDYKIYNYLKNFDHRNENNKDTLDIYSTRYTLHSHVFSILSGPT